MQNSSKVGFHYELADISLSTQHSIIATINGISQSTLLCTHLKKKILLSFWKSQHNTKGKNKVICVMYNVFYIYFQLIKAVGTISRASSLYLPLHLTAGRTLQTGSRGVRLAARPHRRSEEKTAALRYVFLHHVSHEKEKQISRAKFGVQEEKQN